MPICHGVAAEGAKAHHKKATPRLLSDKSPIFAGMKILVNDVETELEGQTVADLSRQLGLPDRGVAIAVGMDILGRDSWETYILKEGDDVMVIKAASGG